MNNRNNTYVVTEIKTLRKDVESIKKTLATKMVTKDHLKNFSTKDDQKNFATKDDLKNFATKDDLKNFATKDDLKNYPTKDDLKNEIKNLVTNDRFDQLVRVVLKNTNDIEVIKETMATKADVNLILDRIDHFTHKVDVFDKKVLVHDHRLNELEPKVERLLAKIN